MINKTKSKETVLLTKTVKSDEAHYEYKLIKRDGDDLISFGIPLYSVAVKMNFNGKTTEARSRELFSDKKRAIAFFERLAENLVTPINLAYVIEDELYPAAFLPKSKL